MLPIFSIKQGILDAVNRNGCVVITAPTGSGKSTQVPRFLLEALPPQQKILVLQPRRLAARMLAERVASEMGEKIGGTVGFQTRYERAISPNTRIIFITEGILTRMLVASPDLPQIGAIVFDEFHERSINTDLGIAMAWHSRQKLRHDLKLLVMSATINAKPICEYLGDCPEIRSEGRMFDVDITYCTQEQKQLGPAMAAAKALVSILNSGKQGDVLIFMPGGYEIRKTIECCQHIHSQEKILLLPLYGDLPPDIQHQVMQPQDCRKVIVATNIAETSLTIPGVRHVIDSGLAKFNRFDPIRGIDSLETQPIARDAAEQRAGRAGREDKGTCQRLWTWIEHSAKYARTTPEIQRVDLAEAVLAVTAFGYRNPRDFPWFEMPPERTLNGASLMLRQLGYISPQGELTELGRKLHAFPAHPRLALLMYTGSQHNCCQLCAWAAAILTERPLVTTGPATRQINGERRGEASRKARAEQLPASDFLQQIELAKAARSAHFALDYCQSLGINQGAARDICRAAEDYASQCRRWGWNAEEASQEDFLKCLLRTFPDRLAKRIDRGTLACNMANRRAELVRESVVRGEELFVAGEMREVAASGVQASKLALSLASGIKEDWLLDIFPDAWQDVDQVYWDEKRQQVLRRQALYCLGLCLDEKIRSDPDPEQAAQILARQIIGGKLPMPNWDENTERWIERVRWVASIFPEEQLPVYDEGDKEKVIQALCYGVSSAKGLKDKDCLAAAKQLLTYKQQQFVEAMAPSHIQLPNGRRMKVEYIPGQTPKGRSRIQDFYDMTQTPAVAGGKIPILLDILAPNNRTVQITDDLTNFWNVLYPKIRNELARRYPRHVWR